MVLKISPATFTLQHCKTRRFVTLTSGNTLAATADTAKAGNVEIFRLPSDQIPGKALMSVDGVWFDQDGVATDHPVASELEEDGQSVRLRDERYELGPCTRLPSSSKARSGIFFPPGWPTSMPDGYDEYMAYELVVSIVATPISLLNYFIFWKYVAGVGDGTKSPAFACFLMLYLDFVSILSGLLSGLPMFAKHYDHRWLCLSFFLNAFATGTIVVAQVCPLPWYLLLSGLAQPFKSLAGVAGKTVSAELERRFASHPNVDLIHLKSCKRNRDTVLNLLSSILCVCYAFHMYNCSIDPSLPGMILTFFMLLSFKLAAEYKKSQVAARVLTSDQASASYDLIEDEASHQPRMEPQGTEQSSEVPTHRFTAKKFAWTLLLVAAEAAVYGGLVTTLSASKDQLEPCTERCLQFKFFGDGSAIPGTGMFPFPVKNGQDQRLLSETCVAYGGMDCDAFIGACSVSRCEERHVRRMVEDRLSRSKSKMGFIASIAVYSALNLAHDLGLEAHLLGPNDAVMLQIFASLSMAVMAACALMWASGAMELFYSPSESCGCYFRLAAVPSVVALALPLNLVSRLRSNVQQAMYAAIIESSCLRTVSFSVPYHFIETAGINGAESLGQLSLLGVKGLGCPRPGHVGVKTHNPWLLFDRLIGARSVKRWAQWLPLLSVGIILFPLLFSSSFIVYRISDLFLAWLEDWLSKHVGQPWQLDRSCGTLALFGVYSMIGMQALVIGYFLSGLWTLYSILAVQLGDWPSDPQMLARLISAKPELRWTLSIARRSYTR
ncbi:unnamed protein product [Cladocopium goreaui]|uniref:Titin n=1 Tax=Cladocopium goreaui TaxID=2562237 RepID=A0A9P1D232_9DINO|nr:unnamed protein product [Cladocopium goreaui]